MTTLNTIREHLNRCANAMAATLPTLDTQEERTTLANAILTATTAAETVGRLKPTTAVPDKPFNE